MESFDVVVVGSGPGGLTAAMMAALRGLKVLVLESGTFGGLLASLYPEKLLLNYPGFAEGIRARELAENWVAQARSYGVELRKERVVEITPEREVKTLEEEYRGRAVVIATGNRPRELGIPGELNLNYGERGVYYYITEPERFRGKRVLVVGGGDTAVDGALDLLRGGARVTLAHRRAEFRAFQKGVEAVREGGVELLLETDLEEILGEESVEGSVLRDRQTGERYERAFDAVVLAVGQVPNDEIFQRMGLEVDGEGRIRTDGEQRTSLPGIFAVGDIVSGTGSLELIVVAAAQGAVAAHHIYLDLAEPYWG
jgi:thioredoxin reductase (NADPH)